MKSRSSLLTVLALVLFSWNASAQVRGGLRRGKVAEQSPVQSFGSIERTKLLDQARGGRGTQDTLRFGSVERRALLTGRTVRFHVPRHSTRR